MNSMTRRSLLAAAAPAILRAQSRPNLVLIMTDQQTHDAMSCVGNRWLKTPAMDSLAAAGTRYTETYCTYPVCSPSRSSIFTSRMPNETTVRVNGLPIASGMSTMGEMFRTAGYDTVYAGKWHLPKSFDGMTAFTRLVGGSKFGKDMDAPVASHCDAWLREKARSPFLMVASFMNPHDICEWIRLHPGAREHANVDLLPPAPANMAVDPREPEPMRYHRTAGYDLMSQGVGVAGEWRRDDFRQYLHDYYRMVEDVDAQIGRVLRTLRETGQDKNTLIAFVSDHGEGLGGHRWVQKAAFYEESVHVPLILAGPGVRRGAVDRAHLASLNDILPTFCDAAGIASPKDARGASLLKPIVRDFVVSELRYGTAEREGRMLRTRRYKYVAFNTGDNAEQFFDLQLDPGETQNLARDPGLTARLEEHRSLLKQWVGRTGDDFRRA